MLTMVWKCSFVLKIFNSILQTILSKNHCLVKSLKGRFKKKLTFISIDPRLDTVKEDRFENFK